jgi:hypothetical protein
MARKKEVDSLAAFDRTGQMIRAGDVILYACSLGRSPALQWGRVIEVCSNTGPGSYSYSGPFKLTVQGVSDHNDWDPPRLMRKATLFFPERTVVIPCDRVPRDTWVLLRDAK